LGIALVLGILVVFGIVNAAVSVIIPAIGSNFSSTFQVNCSYVNETDITNPVAANSSWYFNSTGSWVAFANPAGFADNGSVVSITLNASDTGIIDGEGTINCSLGNATLIGVSAVQIGVIKLDDTKPLVSFISPTPANYSNLSRNSIFVNVSVTEAYEKNITFYLYNQTGTVNIGAFAPGVRAINWTGLNDALYNYSVTIYDHAGNSNSTDTRTIRLDMTRPLVGSLLPATNATFNTSQTIWLMASATDTNGSGTVSVIANITYPNGTFREVSLTKRNATMFNVTFVTPNLPGSYNITFVANDSAGNLNLTEKTTNITLLDITVPSVALTSPSDQVTYTDSSYTINVSLDEPGLCEYQLNENPIVSLGAVTTANRSFSGTNSSIANGDYTLHVYCNDTSGNRNASSSVSFVIDAATEGGDTGGGGGGSNSIVSQWAKEINGTDTINKGQQLKALKNNYRITFDVKGMGHSLVVKTVGTNSATIEVSSTPQTATLSVGETKKFNLDGDNTYDLAVTLNAIQNATADITVAKISEVISTTTATSNDTGADAGEEPTEAESQSWIWIVAGIVIVAIIGFAIYWSMKKK